MKLLFLILFALLFNVFFNFFMMGLGFLLYYCRLKKIGFTLIVMSETFGLKAVQKWLVKHCPFDDNFKCKYWSCKNSPNCPKSKWYGKNK